MEAAQPDREKNINDFLNTGKKAADSIEKSRNVDKFQKKVDEADFVVNRNKNMVYNADGGERRTAWEADPGAGGGRGKNLPPPEPEEIPTGRDGGQDTGPVPTGRQAEAWASGGERTPGAPPGWLSEGEVRFWTPAEETDPAAPPVRGEMGWAEQADRAFRRDSRRYDGGFYLY